VRDDTGRGLIWTDDSGPVLAGTAAPIAPPALAPLTYTPPYLAEKILTSRSALEGERKQVTVLFADLKGSMELLADRDPEEARQLLDPVLERMMAAVHRYEGTVNQVMGDGIMALFGAPLATGLNLSHKLSFARSWGPLQRGDPPWHTSPREPVPMPRFGTARRARCQR